MRGGIVRTILELIGYEIETLDVNDNLKPTYTGDISSSSFLLERKYDCVICAEVLEHISIESFDICLENIKKLTRKYLILTLPNCRSNKIEIGLSINGHTKEINFGKKINEIAPMHYWELNCEERCTNMAISTRIETYFKIIEEGVLMNNKYHYFYILEL